MNRQPFGNEPELRNASAQYYNIVGSKTTPNVLTEPLNVATDGRYDLRHRDSIGHQIDVSATSYTSFERNGRQNGYVPNSNSPASAAANGYSNGYGRNFEVPNSSGMNEERYRSSGLTAPVEYQSSGYVTSGGNIVGKGKPTKLKENQRHALEAIKNSLIPWDRERESVPPSEPVVTEPIPINQQECSAAQMLKNLVELGFDKVRRLRD